MPDTSKPSIGGSVRRRKHEETPADSQNAPHSVEELRSVAVSEEETMSPSAAASVAALSPNTYWLTRMVFIRSLGFVYCESTC